MAVLEKAALTWRFESCLIVYAKHTQPKRFKSLKTSSSNSGRGLRKQRIVSASRVLQTFHAAAGGFLYPYEDSRPRAPWLW